MTPDDGRACALSATLDLERERCLLGGPMPKDLGGSDNRAASGETNALRAKNHASRPAKLGPIAVAEASEGLVARRLRVHPADVVFVKGIVEASEGLAGVFAEAGGELTIAAPQGREADLSRLLEDLAHDLLSDEVRCRGFEPARAADGPHA